MNNINSVPAHSLYGQPVNNARLAYLDGAKLAPPSAPFVGRGSKCIANNDSCEANQAKGTNYCYGHLKSLGLIKKVVKDGSGKTESS